jgi:hypothetical protein
MLEGDSRRFHFPHALTRAAHRTVGCSLDDFVAQVPAASEGDISVWEYMYHEVQVRGKEMCERNLLHHYHNNKVSPPPP